MRMRTLLGRSALFVLALGVCASLAFFVAVRSAGADPTGPGSLGVQSSSRGNISTVVKQVAAEAGNVTELTINANTITRAWQGYFGNVSGRILLQDSLGNNFYAWNNTLITGQIFASRNDTVQWSSIQCANGNNVTAENGVLGKLANEPDSVNQTFALTTHPSFLVASAALANCPSTQAFGPNNQSSASFWNILLADNRSNRVYTTLINRSAQGFHNSPVDFELLVGENGNATSLAPTTYYFYVELD